MDFRRTADSAAAAINSAIKAVMLTIPGAKLIEVGPDLLNLTDMAEVFSRRGKPITRQAMRKYALNQAARAKTPFPSAAINSSAPLWHLHDALTWMVSNDKLERDDVYQLQQIARTAFVVNSIIQNVASANIVAAGEMNVIAMETEKLIVGTQYNGLARL